MIHFFVGGTPEEIQAAGMFCQIINGEGFEVLERRETYKVRRFQMQRGDKIYARSEIPGSVSMESEPAVVLKFLRTFADIAKQNPKPITAQSA